MQRVAEGILLPWTMYPIDFSSTIETNCFVYLHQTLQTLNHNKRMNHIAFRLGKLGCIAVSSNLGYINSTY